MDAAPASGLKGIAVVIPAWQPEARLVELVAALQESGVQHVVLVNDGSSAASLPIFGQLTGLPGVTLCEHSTNRGKGRALKTAFAYVLATMPGLAGVVTADADGQHLPEDIVRVAQQLASESEHPVLGVRSFTGAVPLRSRLGNGLARRLFRLLSGHEVSDTQTGLRGLPMASLPELMALPGERYEYEMVMLAHLCHTGPAPVEIPIQTVYLQGNRGSHFNPLWDSLRVYRALVGSGVRRGRGDATAAAKSNKPHLRTA